MRHVFWLIPNALAGRPGPDRESWNLEELKVSGIGAILSVNEGLLCHPEDFASAGMPYRCLPLSLNAPPQPGDLEHCRHVLPKALDFVEEVRRTGKQPSCTAPAEKIVLACSWPIIWCTVVECRQMKP